MLMFMPYLIALILLMSTTVHAEVYKWVDAEGVVHFTDEPVSGAEKVEVRPMQVISLPKPGRHVAPANKTREPVAHYQSLSITSPKNDEAVRANNGVVTINAALSPSLRSGDRLQVTVDGNTHNIDGLSMTLSNLARGGHSVSASVVDANGDTLISSKTINFFVLRVTKKRPAPAP